MGRPRTKPYTETSVYTEYWGYNMWENKNICLFSFGKVFKSDRKSTSRDKAKRYLEALKNFLGSELKNTQLHTYLVTP